MNSLGLYIPLGRVDTKASSAANGLLNSVAADGGMIDDISDIRSYINMARQNEIYDSILFGMLGAYNIRTSGNTKYVTKGYSMDATPNNATQTTEASQPYLTGFIAPNEKWGLKNPNGGSRYMTHPTISFAANEAWSVSTVVNCRTIAGSGSIGASFWGGSASRFGVESTTQKYFITTNTPLNISFVNSNPYKNIGKNVILTLVKNVSSFDLYENGVFIGRNQTVDSVTIDSLLKGRSLSLYGSISAHFIRNIALTPTQVAAEATKLRQIFPEIPSVTIGSQTWQTSNCEVVATPMGNGIANITANANVEKITNAADREFSSDTGSWTKSAGTTISGGTCNINEFVKVPALYRAGGGIATIGSYYRCTFSISNYSSGSISLEIGTTDESVITASNNGTYLVYFKALTTSGNRPAFRTSNSGFIGSIDNVSVQEVGWSDSQNLYDAVYAQTSGTVEQKTYAAVKAAAMWSYYNNDTALGAIYGKLYNWFAVKLLQMDIDYYNAANPSTPWGWRVPTQTDFNTLATTLGGASVAGGKMKVAGLDYWNSPNTGADNSNGFTLLGGGRRNETGTFSEVLIFSRIWNITEVSNVFASSAFTKNNIESLDIAASFKTRGDCLRLIKS